MEDVESHIWVSPEVRGKRARGFVSFALLLVALPVQTFSQVEGGDRVADILRGNVVRIEARENGFGFIAGERAGHLYIVTAYHVVVDPNEVITGGRTPKVRVEFYDRMGKMYDADLLGTHDSNYDVAVLTVPTPAAFEWTRKCLAESVKRGTPVWFVGREQEWRPPVTPGHVRVEPGTTWSLEIEGLPVSPGSSGGPAISDKGIIGMIQRDSEESTHALSIDFLREFFKEWNHPWELQPFISDGKPDLAAIKKALDTYADSYNRRNASALWGVWPAAPERTRRVIEQSFKNAHSIVMLLQLGEPEIKSDGSAIVAGQYSQEFTGSNGSQQRSKGSITFWLSKKEGMWIIVKVI
jgi:hypothetical protein